MSDSGFIYLTSDFFENEEELMNEIRKFSHVKQYQKNAVISRQDEASETIYILLEGRIEANYIAEDGQKKIFSIFEPRIMFGESNLAGFPNLLNFVCLTPVKVAAIRKQDIYNWDKQMLFTIIHILLCKLKTVGYQLTNQIFDDVEDRIEKLLFESAKLYSKANSEKLTVEVPITHQVIADIVGTSRVRVTQTITKMTREGKITVSGKKIILHTQ